MVMELFKNNQTGPPDKPKTGTIPKQRRVNAIRTAGHFLFGRYSELPLGQLPTYSDIIRCFYLKKSSSAGVNVTAIDKNKIINEIALEVMEIWRNAGIPIIEYKSVQTKISKVFSSTEFQNIRDKETRRPIASNHSVLEKYNKLFNIAACKCYSNPAAADSIVCNCKPAHKIPEIDISFFVDQMHERKMFIGAKLDKNTSQHLNQIKIRHQKNEERKERQKQREKSFRDSEIPSTSRSSALLDSSNQA